MSIEEEHESHLEHHEPTAAEKAEAETERVANIEAEAKKVEKLGVFDHEAKEIAANDRAKADALLTDMKDGHFTSTQDVEQALSARVTHEAEEAREAIGGVPEEIDGNPNFAHFRIESKSPEEIDAAIGRMEAAQKKLEDFHKSSVQPAAETLAKETNPIAHSDYKEREAAGVQNFLRTHFPLFLPVWTLPKSFFRQDRGRTSPQDAGKMPL